MNLQYVVRNGVTNSCKGTMSKGGKIINASHQLFHDGQRVVFVMETTNGITWLTATGLSFNVGVKCGPTGNAKSVSFVDNCYMLNEFVYTNGLFYPVTEEIIKDMNRSFEKVYVGKIEPVFGDLINLRENSAAEKKDGKYMQNQTQDAVGSPEARQAQPQR